MLTLSDGLLVLLGAGLAYVGPPVAQRYISPMVAGLQGLQQAVFQGPGAVVVERAGGPAGGCAPHNYTARLISLDPLLVYIDGFVGSDEAERIVEVGRALLQPSPVTGGGDSASPVRTSKSAPLPDDDAAVACVLARARHFMGTLMAPGRDEMSGAAQMVHYTAGEKFDLHHDWFRQPRIKDGDAGRKRLYNRIATFFVVLQCANCTAGETYFPLARPIAPQDREGKDDDHAGGGGGGGEVKA